MSAPTPVTTSSITPVSGSTSAVTDVSKSPATIHVKSVVLKDCPEATRANTAQEATNEPTDAGTAIQCARRPIARPTIMLMSAPASGKAGINQTVDTASIYRRVLGVSRQRWYDAACR